MHVWTKHRLLSKGCSGIRQLPLDNTQCKRKKYGQYGLLFTKCHEHSYVFPACPPFLSCLSNYIRYREEHRAIIPDRTLLQRDLILLTWKPQGNHRAPKLSWRVRQYKCRVSIPYVELLPGYIKAFPTWISWLTIQNHFFWCSAGSVCLTFAYHMYGRDIDSLEVLYGNQPYFNEVGDKGNIWMRAQVTITGNGYPAKV